MLPGLPPTATLRDYYAAAVVSLVMAEYTVVADNEQSIARDAFKLADAMLAERERAAKEFFPDK